MAERDLVALKSQWNHLLEKLEEVFEEKPTLETILFLIGVQELGRGKSFSKSQKMDLMHVGTCRVLSQYGYYEFEKRDSQDWPHYIEKKQMPAMNLQEQDILLKEAVVKYFTESGFISV